MDECKRKIKKLGIYKYPLLIILIGSLLMLLPVQREEPVGASSVEQALEEVLTRTEGVGQIRVLVSESGAVVVCDGAENAAVRMDILRAIRSYTGLGSDKITILKMMNRKGR